MYFVRIFLPFLATLSLFCLFWGIYIVKLDLIYCFLLLILWVVLFIIHETILITVIVLSIATWMISKKNCMLLQYCMNVFSMTCKSPKLNQITVTSRAGRELVTLIITRATGSFPLRPISSEMAETVARYCYKTPFELK